MEGGVRSAYMDRHSRSLAALPLAPNGSGCRLIYLRSYRAWNSSVIAVGAALSGLPI